MGQVVRFCRRATVERRSFWAKNRYTLFSAAAWAGVVFAGVSGFGITQGKLQVGGQIVSAPVAACEHGNTNICVIDGDTIRIDGVKIRLLDFNTPEISSPSCSAEAELGHRAKQRLIEILNQGSLEIAASGGRDADRYGRKLRRVLVNGRPVGDIPVEEGLAHVWRGFKKDWCA